MKDSIKKLIELQGVDIQILQIEEKIAEIPNAIQENKDNITALETEFEEASKEMNNLLVQKKEKETDLQTVEEELKKHQKEINTLKSNDAYSAVLKEIKNCEQKIADIELEQIELMEKEEQFFENKKERKKQLDENKGRIEGENKELENELARLKALLVEIEAQRAKAAEEVEDGVLAKYDNIRVKKHGIGIVPLQDEACGGCHMVLTPQQVSDVLRGEDTVLCRSCMRIVYFDEKKPE